MKNILIPIDGSDYSKRAMEKGKEFARVFGSNIILLNVKTWMPVSKYTRGELEQYSLEQYQRAKEGFEVYNHNLVEESRKLLKDAKDYFWNLENAQITTLTLEGEAGNTISNYIEKNEKDIDLIIMGSKGVNAGKVKGLFIGSVTMKVISATRTPILIIK